MLIRHAQIDGGDGMDVRVRHGRIEAMAAALTPLADEEVINARGAALLPGLHDHHVHLYAFAAAQASVPCGPPQVREAQALRQALMQASTGLAPGAWLRGVAYHESVAGEIDRDWLDAVLPIVVTVAVSLVTKPPPADAVRVGVPGRPTPAVDSPVASPHNP